MIESAQERGLAANFAKSLELDHAWLKDGGKRTRKRERYLTKSPSLILALKVLLLMTTTIIIEI
jgi:hypothetical protein